MVTTEKILLTFKGRQTFVLPSKIGHPNPRHPGSNNSDQSHFHCQSGSPPQNRKNAPFTGRKEVRIKLKLTTLFLLALLTRIPAYGENAVIDKATEGWMEQLPGISKIGFGYSARFSGSQFLPEPASSQVQTLVIGSQAPSNSPALEQIVRRGILAVPSLLKHLDDARETKVPPMSGMMWMSFADEYDFNSRTREHTPDGVNKKDMFDHNDPTNHVITVGDLCYVALGQIVNRHFNATRYQPTGGLIINSPTYSSRLCTIVRKDFDELTRDKHRDLLIQDFLKPDYEDRRNDAAKRLAFYYPETLEPLVLKQLTVLTFDVFVIEDFVRNQLYRTKSSDKRQTMFDEFIHTNGPAFSDGILLQLFEDLDSQEADEQHRLSPPLIGKYDARALLIQLYKFPNNISSSNKPYIATWNSAEKARFIDALGSYKSQKIDDAVDRIFANTIDDDYLALSYMNRLIGKGYDQEIRAYCNRRLPESKYFADELGTILSKMDSTKQGLVPNNHTNSPP